MNVNTQITSLSDVVPFRPIQYLGNKLRVIEPIVDMAQALSGSNRKVVDLFTGTSVVAQALAFEGFSTTAVDTQRYAAVMASAMLNVGRDRREVFDPDLILRQSQTQIFEGGWDQFARIEGDAIKRQDFAELTSLYDKLPLLWRATDKAAVRAPAHDIALITALYSGTYFGVKQALMLDRLRCATEALHHANQITVWQYHAALTAIMSAASAAVNSAGKHFAQPLLSGKEKNGSFHRKRLIQDRRISIKEAFLTASYEINARILPHHLANCAVQSSAEDFVANAPSDVGLYYLDPPYTAQQYSRFYHLLETLIDYQVPELLHKGKITSGLYPTYRYKSAFSSKTRALPAFNDILRNAQRNGASALISYSASKDKSTGNARMVSLQELISTCRRYYGKTAVRVVEMNHRYRQFNSAAKSNIQRDDPELLIECKTS